MSIRSGVSEKRRQDIPQCRSGIVEATRTSSWSCGFAARAVGEFQLIIVHGDQRRQTVVDTSAAGIEVLGCEGICQSDRHNLLAIHCGQLCQWVVSLEHDLRAEVQIWQQHKAVAAVDFSTQPEDQQRGCCSNLVNCESATGQDYARSEVISVSNKPESVYMMEVFKMSVCLKHDGIGSIYMFSFSLCLGLWIWLEYVVYG